ncbi:MAG: hypothetical protein IPK69_06830 [Phycisphaerales bacterium]|nr:MAG: hypothetical protein IPK69_06830 [Phycisphaerales bacterium]
MNRANSRGGWSVCAWRGAEIVAAVTLLGAGPGLSERATAQIVVPGANGSDGALTITTNTTIDLGLAATAAWDSNSPVSGQGVYDADKWAVVFHYTSVSIAAGRTLTFANHPSRAPVVWLVSGDVVIDGVVNLSGESDNAIIRPKNPGPGGFRGAQNCNGTIPGSAGFGPGGGIINDGAMCGQNFRGIAGFGEAGVYGSNTSATYGGPTLRPLVGGSGGALYLGNGGGAGGGAILIAATGSVTVNGQILANGGFRDWGGSGGGIRIVASSILSTNSTGVLQALGGQNGGKGRIRLERTNATTLVNVDPAPTEGIIANGGTALIWPTASAHTVRILSIGGVDISADPRSQLDLVNVDRFLPNVGGVEVVIATTNVPATEGAVKLRNVPLGGYDALVTPTLIGGTLSSAMWRATVTPAARANVLQAMASATVGQIPAAWSREVSMYRRACAADFDDGSGGGFPDDAVTIDDLLYYIQIFADGTSNADADDGSGTGTGDGSVTIDDLLYVITRFQAGC